MFIYKRILNKLDVKKLDLKSRIMIKARKVDKFLNSKYDENITKIWNKNKNTLKYAPTSLLDDTDNSYVFKSNTIYILNDDAIYHELLHVASTIIDNEEIRCGFEYYPCNDKSLGKALNEGYTDLLVNRYFDKSNKGYILEKHFAYLLEEIVGKDKMEELYFKANLNGLISILSQYDSVKNICDFLNTMDLLKDDLDSFNIDNFAHLSRLLLSWFIKKQKIELENKKISKKTYLSRINKYLEKIENCEDESKYYVDTQKELRRTNK